jgi:EpsD family peptidyl-prolyl cis-trans isomerase
MSVRTIRTPSHRRPAAAGWVLLALALTLAACGEKKQDRAAATLAARVNKGEVSLNQINLVLQQQRNLRPDQADAASRQILERLIDQTLAVQKAEDMGLDRDPRVQQQLDAARRDVLARAYVDKLGEGTPRPTEDDLRRFYQERPALFRERKVYLLQELLIEATPEQVAGLRDKLAGASDFAALTEVLKAGELRYTSNQTVRGPENLPPAVLERVQRMKDGQASVHAVPSGLQVLALLGTRSQPVDEEAARPAIERLLLAERRRARVDEELKALRASARVEYLGHFAQGARPAASAASSLELGPDGATR